MIKAARLFFVCCALTLGACAPTMSESELAVLAENSRPKWQTYQEDIKADIGAGPVAQWVGEPVKAVHEQAGVRVTFQMSGPWAARDTAIPVLIQDPLGRVIQNVSHQRRQQTLTYQFNFSETGSATTLAWIEIKYPNRVKRMILDGKGVWKSQ